MAGIATQEMAFNQEPMLWDIPIVRTWMLRTANLDITSSVKLASALPRMMVRPAPHFPSQSVWDFSLWPNPDSGSF